MFYPRSLVPVWVARVWSGSLVSGLGGVLPALAIPLSVFDLLTRWLSLFSFGPTVISITTTTLVLCETVHCPLCTDDIYKPSRRL